MGELFGIAVKARNAGFWTLDQRLFESEAEAREWAVQSWDGTGCECRVVKFGSGA